MRVEPGEGAESCLAFVRAPNGSISTIRHLPADPPDRDLYGRVELATGLLSEFFKIVKNDYHSLRHEGGGCWASATTSDISLQRAIFLRIESIEGEVYATAAALDNTAKQFSRLFTACHCGDINTLEVARRAGYLPNGSSQYGNTLLHAACSEDQLAVVALLLFMGADTTAKNWAGENPAATARKQGAKASERLLRRFSLSFAPTPPSGSATAATTPSEDHQAASGRQQSLHAASQLHLPTGVEEVEPPATFSGAAAPQSLQEPSPPRNKLQTLVSASGTPENDDSESTKVAVSTTAMANNDAARRKSRLPTGKFAFKRLAPAEVAGSRGPLIRHRRSCCCPRQSKIAGLLALVGYCSDNSNHQMESKSRQHDETRRTWSGHPKKLGKLQRLPAPSMMRLRRKSVTFVGISAINSDDDWYSDTHSSDSTDDASSTVGSNEDVLPKGTLETRKSSVAFVKWLAKKQCEEKITELWRRQSSTAPVDFAVTAANKQRHGIFILACSESGRGPGGTMSGADPLNNASAYRRWVEKRERRSGDPSDCAVSHAVQVRYPRPLLTYEEWLSSKSASAVHCDALSSVNESAATRGQMLGCNASGLTHAEWLKTLVRRQAAKDKELQKKAQGDATTGNFCDWARTMGSRRKTFAEWYAEKQYAAKQRAEEAQSASVLSSRKCVTNSHCEIRPGARTFDSWLLAVEQRELLDRATALKRERLRLRSLLEPPQNSTTSHQLGNTLLVSSIHPDVLSND